MKKIDKLKTIQNIILEVLGKKNNNFNYGIEFEYDKSDSLKIVFNDNFFVKKVCAILEPLSTMYVNFYIDYDEELKKIVCEIF